jgi:hypothetical protein
MEGSCCLVGSSREQDWQPEEGQADFSVVSWRVWCCYFWHAHIKSQMKWNRYPSTRLSRVANSKPLAKPWLVLS